MADNRSYHLLFGLEDGVLAFLFGLHNSDHYSDLENELAHTQGDTGRNGNAQKA
jgi:hypothetical protein